MPKHGDNIWKRKDGRWEARFVKGHDQNGKTLYGSVYGKTLSEVRRKREEVLFAITRDQVTPSSTKTISVIAEEFLEYHRVEIKYSTYARYFEIVQNHLLPDLGLISASDFSQESGNEVTAQ